MPFGQFAHKLHLLEKRCPLKNGKVQQLGTVQNFVMGWYLPVVDARLPAVTLVTPECTDSAFGEERADERGVVLIWPCLGRKAKRVARDRSQVVAEPNVSVHRYLPIFALVNAFISPSKNVTHFSLHYYCTGLHHGHLQNFPLFFRVGTCSSGHYCNFGRHKKIIF